MPTVEEFLIDRISGKVKHVFGVPGDYIGSFYDKLHKSSMDVVNTTTAGAAGIAADAYARINGMGVCCATYCVGGFNLVNAVAGAYAEKSPVVVIVGSPGLKERQKKVLLHHMVGHFECQHKIFERITCANTVLREPDRAGYEIDRVLDAAEYYKQPVYIELPRDIAKESIRYDAYTLGTPAGESTDNSSLEESLAEVTHWINSSKKPVIWAGVEVARYGLGELLMKFAENTNIPVATTILGKSAVNEGHPLSLGVYCESLASDEMKTLIKESDCLIMLGVMMTDMNFGFMPRKYHQRGVILASSSTIQVSNHSYDSVRFQDFAKALLKSRDIKQREPICLPTKKTKTFSAESNKNITVQRFFDMLDSLMSSADGRESKVVISDIGDSLFGSIGLTVYDMNHYLCDAFYASMGFAVPAALGAQLAKPSVRPLVIVGDGAFQATGMEFSTLLRKKLNPIIFVLNNGGYGTERVISDGPFNDLQNWNYEKIPTLMGGGIGFKVTTEGELQEAISKALPSNVPSIINVVLSSTDHTTALKQMFGRGGKF